MSFFTVKILLVKFYNFMSKTLQFVNFFTDKNDINFIAKTFDE